MARYVFSCSTDQDAKSMLVARRALSRGGATVVKVVAGTMLVEVEPTLVAELAKGLPGWRYTVERKSTRIPERK